MVTLETVSFAMEPQLDDEFDTPHVEIYVE